MAGRLESIPGLITSIRDNPAGQVIAIDYANGVTTENSYNAARDWLMSVTTKKGATVLQSISYTRDATGRITGMTTSPAGENWSYSYDEIDRLIQATNTGDTTSSRSFSYDMAGNMLTNSAVGTLSYPSQGYGVARPHAPLSVGGVAQSYDANGNLTTGGGRALSGACPPT
ncbi:RHS repeat protein [Kaistia dalseonensis]|uniref:YD repeat-containing protein n=1 Tax=Kaistia dalseonensis TaxID=410840 RepID=A0ABU0H0W6_9HYPH|nr:RHS repeat domain-containing protein [Kaistia dalseonensis]MCX5493374.1 RHS repeat protein [Kaistia dalseonensis]MDQ0435932.1 YD repeat-containing protein [Kaistia dalseonensis]